MRLYLPHAANALAAAPAPSTRDLARGGETIMVVEDNEKMREVVVRQLIGLGYRVRAADTARLDLSPEAPGLLAASLGLSRMYDDDLEQLSAGMLLYDAFYRWCRDATRETHNWPTSKVRS